MLNWFKKSPPASPDAATAVDETSVGPDSAMQESAAYKNQGDQYFDADQLDAAAQSYEQAITINPHFAEAYNNLGNVRREQGQHEEAERCFKQAIRIKPELANAYYNLGSIFYSQHKLHDALQCFHNTIEIKEDFAEAHNYMGIVFMRLEKSAQAVACYKRALSLRPDYVDAYYNLGETLQEYGNRSEALSCFKRVMEYEPNHPRTSINILNQQQHLCDWSDLETDSQLVRRSILETPAGGKNHLTPFAFFSLPGTTPNEQKRCAERFAKIEYQQLSALRHQLAFNHQRPRNQRIRLGYLSADFHDHATARLMAEIFELHDRNHFHITAYSYGPNDDSVMRKRLEQTFDQFVDIRDDSHEESAKKIYTNKTDILIDLKGYTQNCRSAILALRPAPIQVNYLGYPGTMGADFVDYLIADSFIIPPELQKYYTEKVVHLPDCYQPTDRSRPRLPAPARKSCDLPEGSFVFCCFNQTYKITPDIFDIWCRLLLATPDSILWLFASTPHAEENLKREAESRGVHPERLILANTLPAEQHLARLQCADLFLDTIPVNAHTTCSDALWMGLPVITCTGETFPSRVAGSLLTALGLPELITYNLDDYYNLALDLASDRMKLEAIRIKILANRETAPLFDSLRFTRNLEKTYFQMIDDYTKQLRP